MFECSICCNTFTEVIINDPYYICLDCYNIDIYDVKDEDIEIKNYIYY